MQSTRIAVVAVPLAVLLATGARAAGAQVPSDPCTQVTPAQVSAALGETVSRRKTRTSANLHLGGQPADAHDRDAHVLATG